MRDVIAGYHDPCPCGCGGYFVCFDDPPELVALLASGEKPASDG